MGVLDKFLDIMKLSDDDDYEDDDFFDDDYDDDYEDEKPKKGLSFSFSCLSRKLYYLIIFLPFLSILFYP